MATSTSSRNAQDHYANLKDKIKFLPDDLKEIVSANLATSLQTGFSALSPTEMKEMKKDLSALIADPNVSEPEKEKFRLLETEIAVRYPPKIELTGEMSTKLVSRDNLAKAISENRRSKEDGIPSGTITFSTIFPAEKLENYPLYTEMEAKYKEAVEHKDDKKLEELDTQFAEKIILFKDFYIQINNEKLEPGATDYKSGDELRKEAIQWVRGLKGIGEEVEYVQLFDQTTNKVYYVLRRKKQEQEEIEEEKLTEILDIKLKGKEVVTLNIGDDYTDEGAEATLENKKTKVKKKLPTSEIDVAVFKDHQLIGDLDNMDTNEPGEYEIKYTVEAEETFEGEVKPQTREVTRIVKIEGVKNEVEEIEHTLTLEVLGDNPATLQQGETFVDEGAIATWDGEDVSEDIKVTGTVDTNTPWTYELVYSIKKKYTDHEGKEKTKTKTTKRKIIVKEEDTPPPPPRPEPEETFDISGVLSNVSQSYEDMISREVENELKDEWNNMAWYNPKRFTRFFNRGRLRRKRIDEKKKNYGNDPFVNNANINDEMSAQADRHELELQNNVGKVEKKTAFKLDPATATGLNQLGKDFIEGKVNAFQFQKTFNDLLKNDDTVKQNRKDLKADFIGTNILEKLKHYKAERDLNEGVKTLLESLATAGDKKSVEAQIMKKISDHVLAFQKDPRFRKELEKSGGKIDDAQLLLHLKDKIAKEQLALGNLNIKLDLLDKGEGAYQINNKDRENWVYKFGHWMDKLPRWGQALVGVGMWGIIMGSGGLATALGASAVVAGGVTAGASGIVVGFRTFVKKWTHHTKEQNTHEKDTTRDFTNVQAKMAQWRAEKDDKSLSWWKRYKAKRQYELYETTTQSAEKFADTKQLSDTIMKGLTLSNLSEQESDTFNLVILDAYARLDFYRSKGHNFLKSENANQIEQDFRALEKSLQLVAERQGGTLTDIPALIRAKNVDGSAVNYNELRGEFEKDYQKARTKFWQERARLATKWGLTAGALAAGMSVASQYFTHSGLFSEQTKTLDPMKIGETNVGFEHTGSKLYEDTAGKIAGDTQNIFTGNPNLANATKIDANIGSWTDLVKVIPGGGRANLANYNNVFDSVKSYVDTLPSGATKDSALQFLKDAEWMNMTGMNNEYLNGMRALKTFEGVLQGYTSSWSTIPLDFHYVPDLASTTTKVGQAIFDATSTPNNGFPIVDRVLASFIPVVAGLTSNTYRRNGKDIEKPNYGKDTILVRNNKQGEVDLIKVDTNNRPLAGAKFIVKDANGKVIDSWESTDQPHKITGLNAGTYTVVETTPPAGHQLSDEAIELTVDNEGNVTKRKIDRSQVPVTVEEKPENIKGDDLGKKETTNEKDKESIEKVFGKYPQLKKLYSALVDQGKIKKLSLDTTTFVSKNDRDDGKGAIITLGSKYNEGMRYQQDTLFKNQTDDLARKLAHELMHSVVPTVVMKENSPMESLFTALKDVRKHDEKKGLSMLVSKYLWTYQGAGLQANEDMTELFAMYAIDPDHLKEYLTNYLVNISDAEADRLGLKKLSPEVGLYIYELVDKNLKAVVKGDLSGIDKQIDKVKLGIEPRGEKSEIFSPDGKRRMTFNEKGEIVFADVKDEDSEAAKKAEIERKKKELNKNTIESLKFTTPHLQQEKIMIDGKEYPPVVKIHDRPVSLINIWWTIVPFYITTGQGGKNLKPGWYPFFGYGKDGWLNKTHWKDMANYYEEFVGQEVAKVWENIANELAKQYGTDPEKFQHTSLIEGSSRPVSEFADKFEDYLNDKLMVTPVNNNGDPTENIKKIGTQIKKDLKFEEKEDKEEEERKKLTRLKEIKEKITNQIFIDALKETTKESESLSLRGIDNKDLNKNRDTIIELLPKLKNLKIEGTKSDQLSTDSLARNKLEDNILQFFRENIETLELPNNYFTDLNWLRGESQLKKIDLSDNGITTINYDDFQDLPKGCEIILKGNNPISQETWDKNIANKLKIIK